MANIVRLDIMEGKPRTFVYSKELENGYFLKIVGKADNAVLGGVDYEAYKVELADADTDIGDLLFHKSVENMYDERMVKSEFKLPAGKPGRGYFPVKNDIVTIPQSMITGGNEGNMTKEAPVYLSADGKLAMSGTVKVGKIEALEDIEVDVYRDQFGMGAVGQDLVQKSVVIRFTI